MAIFNLPQYNWYWVYRLKFGQAFLYGATLFGSLFKAQVTLDQTNEPSKKARQFLWAAKVFITSNLLLLFQQITMLPIKIVRWFHPLFVNITGSWCAFVIYGMCAHQDTFTAVFQILLCYIDHPKGIHGGPPVRTCLSSKPSGAAGFLPKTNTLFEGGTKGRSRLRRRKPGPRLFFQ